VNPARGWFITGTDTGVGKTHVACGLLRALAAARVRAVGFKPVATGCTGPAGALRNDDALALMAAGGVAAAYETVNPYAFAPPIAPHLAARAAGVAIRPEPILRAFASLAEQAEAVVVEGAGGWRVPLGEDWEMGDLARQLRLPVILVVGMRLGCLNHALLSAEAIGDSLCGWVANEVDAGMESMEGNLVSLRERLPVPCLGMVPFGSCAGGHLERSFFTLA
jgi:dethiobiotin synthetase